MPRFDWRWLLMLWLLLQFVSEAHGSAGAWLRNTLRGQSVLNWGAARTGSGNAGVAAEDSYIPLQNRTAEVGHASAANEMQTLWVLQQHKQNLVKSFKSPVIFLLLVMLPITLLVPAIVDPRLEQEKEALKAEEVTVTEDLLLARVARESGVVTTCICAVALGYAYAFWLLMLALLKLPFNPYARLKIGSLAQYLMKQVQEMSQLAMEQLQGSPQPEPPQQQQPEEEVDEASTDRS